MSKYTLNGWFVAEHAWNFVSVCTKEKTVCTLSISEEDATEENQDELTAGMLASAKLIAAAPQMLDALEAIIKRFQPEQHDAAGCMFKNCELCKAIAVIKAAKGEI